MDLDDSVSVETLRDPLKLHEAQSGRINHQIDQEHAKLAPLLSREMELKEALQELGASVGGADHDTAVARIEEEMATITLRKGNLIRKLKQLEKDQLSLQQQ